VLPRALPVALVVGSALADARGLHTLGLYLLLAAVPAAASSAMTFFGRLLELSVGAPEETIVRVDAVVSALTLLLVVVAATVRSPAILVGGVPTLSHSAVVACLCLYSVQGLVLAARTVPRERVAATLRARA
jgi:hypothetical protein